jgi:hypothetical protein
MLWRISILHECITWLNPSTAVTESLGVRFGITTSSNCNEKAELKYVGRSLANCRLEFLVSSESVKIKVNFGQEEAMNAQRGSRVILYSFFNLSAR